VRLHQIIHPDSELLEATNGLEDEELLKVCTNFLVNTANFDFRGLAKTNNI